MVRTTLAIHLLLLLAITAITGGDTQGLPLVPISRTSCTGSIAECMGTDELEMDSNSARRILGTRNYISYDALKRFTIPCSQRGSSYYNCKPGASANNYTRGCSAITQCRS